MKITKTKIKDFIKTALKFLFNPRLLLCVAIAWMITNGWCYVFTILGTFFRIDWMLVVGAAYASLLWIPFTPEKIITVAIAIFLLKTLFPNDTKTLAILYDMQKKAKASYKRLKARRSEKKNQKKTERKSQNNN